MLCCKYQLYDHNNIDSEDDPYTSCRNVSLNQQQSISGLHQPGPINQPQTRHCAVNTNCMTIITLDLEMTPTQVVKTSVSTNNSPSQDYTNPDDQPTTNTRLCYKYQLYDHDNIDSGDDSHAHRLSKRQSQPAAVYLRTTPTRTDQPTTNTTLCNKYQLYDHNNISSGDDSYTSCQNVSLNQQQSFSGLRQPGRSTNHKHDTVL